MQRSFGRRLPRSLLASKGSPESEETKGLAKYCPLKDGSGNSQAPNPERSGRLALQQLVPTNPRSSEYGTQQYLAYFGRFIRAFAGKAFSTGTAWCIDGNLGGALWLPPGAGPNEVAITSILDESVSRDMMADVNSMFAEMAAFHPRNPHWYLSTIGIEPHVQRMGFGSALLAEALGRCDHEHMPAYLESSNPANETFYRRLGFEPPGVIRAGHSPPMVPMLRGAR